MAFAFVLAVSSVATLSSLGSSQSVKSNPCVQIPLPVAVRQLLEQKYGYWTVQKDESLSKFARERWSTEKPLACPGVIQGEFLADGTKAYVLLLVPREHPDSGYRIIAVANQNQPIVVEASEDHGSSNYFLRKVRTADYFDREKTKKFKPQTKDSFLVIDSAEEEYGADLYFWTEGHFRKEPVDE